MSGFKSVLATVYDDAWMMQKTMWMQGKSPLLMITRCENAAMQFEGAVADTEGRRQAMYSVKVLMTV